MNDQIALGVIGLGAMGLELLDVADVHPDFKVAVCSDVDPAHFSGLKEKYPHVRLTLSSHELIDSDEIDAIYIATPPVFHAEYAVRALKRGKHVFCEKPLAIGVSDGAQMVAVAGETGLAAAVNFALADRHAVLEIERALKAGEIGDVRAVDVRLLFPEWPRPFQADAAWLAGRQQGGFMREVFSHFAYLTDRLLGPITPSFTQLEFPLENPESSEIAAIGLLHAGDIPVRLIGQTRAVVPETYEWYLYGSRRSYCLRNWGELLVSDGAEWSVVDLDGERGSERTRLSAFARVIRGEKQANLADFAAGLRVQKVVETFHSTAESKPYASTTRNDPYDQRNPFAISGS